MPAGLGSHGDNRVDAALGEPARLGHRGRRGENLRSGALHAVEQIGRRQPEMKADDFRPIVLDHACCHRVEWCAPRGRLRHVGVEPGLDIIAGEALEPGGLAFRIVGRVAVAEEIEVDRAARTGPHPVQRRP